MSTPIRVIIRLHESLGSNDTPIRQFMIVVSPSTCIYVSDLSYRLMTQFSLGTSGARYGIDLAIDLNSITKSTTNANATAAAGGIDGAGMAILPSGEPIAPLIHDLTLIHVLPKKSPRHTAAHTCDSDEEQILNHAQTSTPIPSPLLSPNEPVSMKSATKSKSKSKRKRAPSSEIDHSNTPSTPHTSTSSSAQHITPSTSTQVHPPMQASPASTPMPAPEPTSAAAASSKKKKRRKLTTDGGHADVCESTPPSVTSASLTVPVAPILQSPPAKSVTKPKSASTTPGPTATMVANTVDATAHVAPSTPAPISTDAAGQTRSKKKKRRGKKKKKTAAAVESIAKPTNDSSDSDSDSDSDSGNGIGVVASRASEKGSTTSKATSNAPVSTTMTPTNTTDVRHTKVTTIESTSPQITHSNQPPPPATITTTTTTTTPPVSSSPAPAPSLLTRLSKGHFKFVDSDDDAAPIAVVSSPPPSTSVTPMVVGPHRRQDGIFFVSTKDHHTAMPREKQQRAQRQRQPNSRDKVHTTTDVNPVSTIAHTGGPQRHGGMSAVPFDYSTASTVNDRDVDGMCIDSSDSDSDSSSSDTGPSLREKVEVERAMELYGTGFIAPRTLKRIGGGNIDKTLAAETKTDEEKKKKIEESEIYPSSPLVDLRTYQLESGDILVFRVMELSSEWTPIIGDWKRCQVESHDLSNGTIQTTSTMNDSERKEGEDESKQTLAVKDLLETRLLEGPSFTEVLRLHRQTQREERKKEKQKEKHSTTHIKSSNVPTPSSTSSSSHASYRPSRPRTSTRFSLMSNVVRMLQQRQKNGDDSNRPTPTTGDSGATNATNRNNKTQTQQQTNQPLAQTHAHTTRVTPPNGHASPSPVQQFILPSFPSLPSITTASAPAAAPPAALPLTATSAASTPASTVTNSISSVPSLPPRSHPLTAPIASASPRPSRPRPLTLRAQAECWSPAQVAAFLRSEGVRSDLIADISNRAIDGKTLLTLTRENVREVLSVNGIGAITALIDTDVAALVNCVGVIRGEFRAPPKPTPTTTTTNATTTSTPMRHADPSLADIEQMLQRKRNELMAKENKQP